MVKETEERMMAVVLLVVTVSLILIIIVGGFIDKKTNKCVEDCTKRDFGPDMCSWLCKGRP